MHDDLLGAGLVGRPHLVDRDRHAALLRELDGIGGQVDQHLPKAAGVADESVGDTRIDVEVEAEPLLARPQDERVERVAQRRPQREGGRVEIEPAGFDFREVEDVVDDRQQRVGRQLHHVEVFALVGREPGLQRQARHADDAVHRRPDLVAHVRQELALRAVGELGVLRHLLRVQHRLTELRVGDFEVAGGQLGLLFRAAQLVLGAPALGYFLAKRARPILDHRLELTRPLAGAADVQAEEAAAAQQDQGAGPELEQPPLVVAGLEL